MQRSCADEVICSSVTTRCKSTKKEYFSLAFESCLHVPCLWKCHSVSDFPGTPWKAQTGQGAGQKLCLPCLEKSSFPRFPAGAHPHPSFLIHLDAAWGRQSYLSPHCWTGRIAVSKLSSPLVVAALLLITAWQLWLEITGLPKGRDYQVALSQEKKEFT